MPDLWGLVQFTENTIDKKIVEFKDSDLDKIKWSLRQLYYKQRNYFFANEKYSNSIRELNFFKDLKLKKPPAKGVSWPPKITLTPSGWEAFVKWGNKNIIIRRDGKVWVK